jgi:hypothetical protein
VTGGNAGGGATGNGGSFTIDPTKVETKAPQPAPQKPR